MTTKSHDYPTRVPCLFQGKSGQIVLDQIRTVARIRLVKKLGTLTQATQDRVIEVLTEMFAR